MIIFFSVVTFVFSFLTSVISVTFFLKDVRGRQEKLIKKKIEGAMKSAVKC